MSNYYTAVGSRDVPVQHITGMMRISARLRDLGWIFRSGKADGSDAIFQSGAQFHKLADYSGVYGEVYKPWNNFNTAPDSRDFVTESGYTLWDWWDIDASKLPNWGQAQVIASTVHPAWDKLKQGAKNLHSRNCYQVLGKDLNTPSKFLICYAETQGKSVKGGTRTAYELARSADIPCFNLFTTSFEDVCQEIKRVI